MMSALLLGDSLPFAPGVRYSDAATSHYGAALHLRRSVLEQGEFPLWQETNLIGQPFAANPLNKTAYPPQLLALVFAPIQHLNLLIGLHIALAGWGMWRWTRVQGLPRAAAALSAAAYALAPRLLAHTSAGHLDILYAMAWWPHLMTAVERLARPDAPGARVVLETALSAALVSTADIRTALFAFALAGTVFLWRIFQRRGTDVRWAGMSVSLARAGAAVAVTLSLTAALSLPLIAWLPSLTRGTLTAQEAGNFSLHPLYLLGLVMPTSAASFEFLTYSGLLVLLLALLAVAVQPRRLGFWAVVCLLAAWYALGIHSALWAGLVSAFPFLLWFRVPARAWLIIALILPMLAGHGLHLLVSTQWPHRRQVLAGIRIVGLVLVSLSIGLSLITESGVLQAVSVGTMTLAAVFVSGERRRWFAPVLMGIVVLDLAWAGVKMLEWRPRSAWLDPYAPLAQALHDDSAARIYSPDYALPQEAAAAFNLSLFYGVDPFQVRGVVEVIHQASGLPAMSLGGYSVVQPPLADPALPDVELLRAWSVSHIVAAYPIEEMAEVEPPFTLDVDGQRVYVYRLENPAPANDSDPLTGWRIDAAQSEAQFPTHAEVERRNTLTLAAYGLSASAWVIAVSAFLILRRRNADAT